jgi:hypothetical protein
MGFSQTKLPVVFRVEKQAMSTPMSSLEEMFFMNYYYSKPVNVKFDGALLSMYFDNGATYAKKNVTEVNRSSEFEDNNLVMETILFTDNANVSDTISLIVDYSVGYVQLVLPTKNSKGDYVGYTSFKNFDKSLIKENMLAIK